MADVDRTPGMLRADETERVERGVGRSIRGLALVWRLALLVVSGWGLYLNTGLSDGALDTQSFSYFTILSNLLVFGLYLFVTAFTVISLRHKTPAPVPALDSLSSGIVLVCITITALVYNFVLVPRDVALGEFTGGDLADVLVHTWVPLLAVGDWLLFSPKGRFGWRHALVWLVAPAAYAIFALIRAEVGPVLKSVGSRYPYFFLDVDEFGWQTVIVNIGWLLVGFLLLNVVVVVVDNVLAAALRRVRSR